jgi:heme exporter protein A
VGADAVSLATADGEAPTATDVDVPLLEARRLVRHFGAVTAVDGVGFALRPGEFLTVFGPNGAGKSTLLRILGGGLRPTSGRVLIGGQPLRTGDPASARRLGVLSHQGYLYAHLTAAENLRFFGRLYGLADLDERIPTRLDAVGLLARRDDRVGTFSRGMRQRLALARTLLHDPDVVLLDEPYTGLDAYAADVLRGVLEALKDGRRTVVLVTHALAQGLELADRVAVQVNGRWVMDGPRSGLGDAARFEVRYRELVEDAR